MPKSILLIGNFPPPFGGVPIHLEFLAPFLANRGWKVDVITQKTRREGLHDSSGFVVHATGTRSRSGGVSLLLRNSAKVVTHLKFLRENPRLFLRALEIYEQGKAIAAADGIDLISAYHFFPSGLAAAWLSSELNVPYVLTVFGEIYEDPQWFARHMKEAKMIMSRATARTSCSKHCARSVDLLQMREDVDPIYYGVDTDRFSGRVDGTEIRARHSISPDEEVILFVGRMTRDMGLGVFLDAVPLMLASRSKLRFLVVGQVAELTEAANRKSAELNGRLVVAQNVSFKDLPAYYAAADVAVVPSINKRACLGLAIIEAMASGTPVVVADIGGGPEVVRDPDLGRLVPPLDAAALARASVGLLAMGPEERVLMTRAARHVAVSEFDSQVCGEKVEAFFARQLKNVAVGKPAATPARGGSPRQLTSTRDDA